MKKILFLILAGLLSVNMVYASDPEKEENTQAQEEEEVKYDTIYKLGGKQIVGNVVNVRTTLIYYILPGEEDKREIKRKEVQRIEYKNGRIEKFNDPLITMVEEGDWKAIFCTKKKKDVESLYKRGEVYVEEEARSRSIKAAKNNAKIKIKKKAANMGGNVVYLKKVEAKGGFGDFPSYTMEGVVYSFEPPKPGEAGYPKQ